MAKPKLTDEQQQDKTRKEGRISGYLYLALLFLSVAGLCDTLLSWHKSPSLLYGFDLVVWCGLLIGFAFGYSDSQRALRTGNVLPSFGFVVGLVISLFSNIGKDICKSNVPTHWLPWILCAWLLVAFATSISVPFCLRRALSKQRETCRTKE